MIKSNQKVVMLNILIVIRKLLCFDLSLVELFSVSDLNKNFDMLHLSIKLGKKLFFL